jgi:hypothetical protein
MNVNFGLIPPLMVRRHGRAKKEMMSRRALADMTAWARQNDGTAAPPEAELDDAAQTVATR